MLTVFVSSAYGGDPANLEHARRACRYVVDHGAAPFAPHLLFPQFMAEAENWKAPLAAWLCGADEFWAFGAPTPGMQWERALAESLGIPVREVASW